MDNITSALGRRENPILASPFVPPSHSHFSSFLSFSPFSRFHTTPFPGHERYWITVRKEYEVPLLSRRFHNSRTLSLKIRDKAQRDRWSRDGRWCRGFRIEMPALTLRHTALRKILVTRRSYVAALSYCCGWRNPEKETYESSWSMIVSWGTMRFLIASFNDNSAAPTLHQSGIKWISRWKEDLEACTVSWNNYRRINWMDNRNF